MKNQFRLGALLIAVALSASSVWAADVEKPSDQANVHNEFISGGIGDGDTERLMAVKSQYNLRLTFVEKSTGAYLSDVKVEVLNAKKQIVISTVSTGPFLFAKLPKGSYTVNATSENQQLSYKFIAPKSREHVFYFNP